jgi:uncharacterized delta-60 repeat protein
VAGLELTPGGKLIAAAIVGPNGTNNFGVFRFNPDGTADETFGTDGMVVTEMGAFAAAASAEGCSAAVPGGLVLQPDGKVVVVGTLECYGAKRSWSTVGLVRYDVDGSLDRTFGTDGILLTVLQGAGAVVTHQPDGSLVVGTSSGGFALARYRADGILDKSFGTDGTARMSFDAYPADPSGLLTEPDGKIVINGFVQVGTNSRGFALARFEADGTPDPTFGTNGVTTTITGYLSISTGPGARHWTLMCDNRCVSPVVRQPDGRFVVADGARNSDQVRPTFRLHRFADAPTPAPPAGGQSPTTTTRADQPSVPTVDPPGDESPTAATPANSSTPPGSPAQPLTPGSAPSMSGLRPAALPDAATGAATPPPSTGAPTPPSDPRPSPADRDESAAAVTAERKNRRSSGLDAMAMSAGAALLAGVAILGARRRRRA